MAPLDVRLDELAAEVREVRGIADRAQAHAAEALRRVADVRVELAQAESRQGDQMAEVVTMVGAAEARLGATLGEIQASEAAHRDSVVAHLDKLWGVATDLRDNDRDQVARLDAMGQRLALLYALLTGLGVLLQRFGGG